MRADRHGCALLCVLASGCLQGVAPYPRDDVATTREDESIAIDVLENDVGAERVTYVPRRPSLGDVVVRSDGTVHYTPHPERSGEDSFTYIAENEHGATEAHVTVHIEIDSNRFAEPRVLLSGPLPFEPFAARLNRDGQADLILQAGDQTIALLGDGDGFREVQRWGELRCCLGIAPLIADLDGDGDTDIVRFDERGGLTIHLVEATASGREIAFEDHALTYDGDDEPEIEGLRFDRSIPEMAASGDFDGDGAIDLAVRLDDIVTSVVLHSDVSRGRPARSRLLTESPTMSMTSGDVTGDGRTDLVLQPGAALDIFTFDGDEVSLARVAWPEPERPGATQVLIAQLDEDAPEELILIDRHAITVLELRVAGDEVEVESVTVDSELQTAVLADVVGDRRLDLVGTRRQSPVMEIWQAVRVDGKTSFEPFADFPLLGQVHAFGAPAMLPFAGEARVVAERFNEERGEHELVVFSSPER